MLQPALLWRHGWARGTGTKGTAQARPLRLNLCHPAACCCLCHGCRGAASLEQRGSLALSQLIVQHVGGCIRQHALPHFGRRKSVSRFCRPRLGS